MDNETVIEDKNQRLTTAYFSMNDEGRVILDKIIKKLAESSLRLESTNERDSEKGLKTIMRSIL